MRKTKKRLMRRESERELRREEKRLAIHGSRLVSGSNNEGC